MKAHKKETKSKKAVLSIVLLISLLTISTIDFTAKAFDENISSSLNSLNNSPHITLTDNIQTTTICYGTPKSCYKIKLKPVLKDKDKAIYQIYEKYAYNITEENISSSIDNDKNLGIIDIPDNTDSPIEENTNEEDNNKEDITKGQNLTPESDECCSGLNVTNGLIHSIQIPLTINNISNNISASLDKDTIENKTQVSRTKEENITQLSAEIDKPVRWIKRITVENKENKTRKVNISLKIPIEARNIAIERIGLQKKILAERNKTQKRILQAKVSTDAYFEIKDKQRNEKLLEINDNINKSKIDYEIIFETEPPKKQEIEKGNGVKQVRVYSNSSLHYKDVKASSTIPEHHITPKIYHIINNNKIDVTNNPDYDVKYIDTNNNSLSDRIEWIVPQLSEQLFEIGLAAINTKKSIYHPNETAEIIIVVLDNSGKLVSDADVTTEITNPDNTKYLYSTRLGSIIETKKGIYELNYSNTRLEGNYSMAVYAIGDNVNNTMLSYFTVKEYYEFDILRQTPITTDPWQGEFTSSIRIISFTNTTSFDFSEILPIDFVIIDKGGSTESIVNNKKILIWQNLKNDSIISYSVLPLLISPALYEIGQSQIHYGSKTFTESRPWYLAVDPSPETLYMESGQWSPPTGSTLTDTELGDLNDSDANGLYLDANGVDDFGGTIQNTKPVVQIDTISQVHIIVDWVNLGIDSGELTIQGRDSTSGGTLWCSGTDSGSSPTTIDCDASHPFSAADLDNLYVWVINTGTGNDDARITYLRVEVVYTEIDNPPIWSDNQSNITAIYSPTSASEFNITWNDTFGVDTAWFESNYSGSAINYSMNGISGNQYKDVYNYSAVLPAGTYYWMSHANDTAKQWNNTDKFLFTIARATPLLNLTINGSNNNLTMPEDNSILLNGTIISGDNQNLQMYLNGTLINNNTSPISNNTLFSNPGYYNMTLIYEQSKNYTGTFVTNYVNVTDATPPNITLVGPENNSFTNNANVTFFFNVSDYSEIANCTLDLKGGALTKNKSAIDRTIINNISIGDELPATSLNWTIECIDLSPDRLISYSEAWIVTIDITIPSANYIRPKTPYNNEYLNDSIITINVSHSDDYPDTIWLYLNDTINQTRSYSGSYTNFTLNLSDGAWRFNVTLNDSAGNTRNLSTVNIIVDTEKPTIDFIGPTPDNNTNQSSTDITINVTHIETNPHTISLYLNGIMNQSKSYTGPYTNFSLNNLNDGVYTYYVWLNDSAGNTNQTKVQTIKIDSTPPNLFLISPQNNIWVNNATNTVLFEYNVTDETSEISECSLKINLSSNISNGDLSGSYDSTGGNYTNLTYDDDSYWYMGSDAPFAVIDAFSSIVFNLSSLIINENDVSGLNISLTYCHSRETICDGNNATGNAEIDQNVSFYNYSSGKWITLGHLNFGNGGNETNSSYSAKGAMSDFINDSSNEVKARFRVQFANLNPGSASFLVMDFVRFDVTLGNISMDVSEGITQNFSFTLKSGYYNWKITCLDELNHENSSENKLIKSDLTFPAITNMNANQTNITVNSYICLNVTVSDTFSDVNTTWAKIRDPDNLELNVFLYDNHTTSCDSQINDGTYSREWEVTKQGLYNWTITYANDTAGNLNSSATSLVWNSTSTGSLNVNLLAPAANIKINESEPIINYTYNHICYVECISSSDNCTDVNIYAQYNFSGISDISTSSTYLVNLEDSYSCSNLSPGQECNHTFTIRSDYTGGATIWNILCKASSANFGDYSSTNSINITINDHPIAQFSFPTNGTWLNNIETLNASSSTDDSNITKYIFEIDNNTNFDSSAILCNSADINCTFNTSSQSECDEDTFNCYIRLNVTDSDGLENSTYISIQIDNTKPRASLNSPLNNTWDSDGTIDFTYTPYDTNIHTCILYHNASGLFIANKTNNTVVNGTQDVFSINLSDGNYIWNIWCNDSAGNSAFNNTNYSINVDTTYPKINFAGGTADNNSYFNRDWIYVNITANDDNEANITFYLFNSSKEEINVTTLPAGTRGVNFTELRDTNEVYYYNVTIEDYANNKNSTETRKITLDTKYPSIDFAGGTAGNDSYFNRDWIYVNVSIMDDNTNITIFYLYNSSSNLINSTNFTDGTTYINFTGLTDTNEVYYYNVTHIDKAGFENSTETRNITLDSINPLIGLNEPDNNTLTNNNNLQFNYTPVDTYLKNCSLWGNFSGNWQLNQTNTSPTNGSKNSFNSITLEDGSYVWNVECYDKAGNSAFNSSNYTLEIDTTPPAQFNLVYPPNNTYSTDTTPFFNWSEPSESNFDNYTIIFDDNSDFSSPDKNYSTIGNISNSSFTIPPYNSLDNNTIYYWKVIAYDTLGYSKDSTQVFIYGTDNILPIINLESPQNNSEEAASSIINFQFNVTDANDISNCSLVINGAIDPDDITSNPTRNTTITISRVLSNGFYNWSINCTDIAGNTNKSKTRNLSINVQIPGEIFFETYSSNAASIYLNRTEEGTGYSNSATCRRDQSIEVIEAVTTQGIGKNGFLIKGLQPINFTGHFVNDKAPIITWRLYHDYDNGSGWVQLAQDGNDASGGTGTDVNDIASSVKNSTPAGDIYLNSSGRLRLTANIWYTTGGTSYTCYHYYDNGNSFVKLFGYVLGFLDANISSPLADPELIEGSNFNVSCDIRCDDGWCMNTKVYVQYKTPSTSWTDISTTGNLVLADGETNPQVIGDINLTQKINFSIKANTISRNNAIRCRAESTYSNSTGAVNTTITIRDATYPTVSLNNPQNNSWESDGNVTFYYTPDDNHNVSNCSLIINNKINQTNTTIQNHGSNNFTLTSLNEGSYNWSINCTDSFDNTNSSETWIFNIDTTYPKIFFGNGTEDNNTYFNRDWIYVNVSIIDDNTNITIFYLYNSSFNLINSTNFTDGTTYINFTGLTDINEEYYYNVTHIDKAGNINTTETRKITLDTNNPEIDFAGETEDNNSYFNRDWIYINISASDDNEANITFYLFNSSKEEINVTTLPAGTRSVNFTELTDTNEVYYYNVTIIDKANNINSTETRKITLDTKYPSIDFAGGTADNNTYFNRDWVYVNVSITDDNTNITIFYLYNSSFNLINSTNFTDGTTHINFTGLTDTNEVYYYNVTIFDKANNINSTITRKITLDDTNPRASLNSPLNNTWDSDGTIDFTYTPYDTNIHTCILYHNASSLFIANETNDTVITSTQDVFSISLSDGNYVWNIWCNDSAGNSAFNNTNYSINVDTTYPEIDFAGGTADNDSYFNRGWIYINVTADDDNEANITFYLFNSSKEEINVTTLPAGTRSVNFTELTDTNEVYYYNVTIEDYANNKNSTETRKITLDTSNPQIGFAGGTADNNSYFNRNWIYVNVSIIDDNTNITIFYLYNSSFNLINSTNFTDGTTYINFTGLTDTNEVYYYNVTIFDKANNINSTVTRKITLDTTYPAIEFTDPTQPNNTNQSSVNIIINVTHTEENPNTIILYVNESHNQSRQYSGTYTNFTLTNLNDGTYTYYVWLNDSAANTNRTETRTITIDTTPPVINLINPENNTWRNNESKQVLFEYNASDSLLEIANCSLILNNQINQTNYTLQKDKTLNFTESLANGNHTWSINCSDTVGNINNSEQWLIKVDLTFPRIANINVNVTNASTTTYICLNATITDTGSGVNWTKVYILPPSGKSEPVFLYNNITTSCDQSDTDNVYSAEYRLAEVGEYNWTTIEANDTAGNLNSTVVGLIWDSTTIGTMTVNMTSPTTNLEINESDQGINYTYNQTCAVICDDTPQNCTNVYLYAQYNLSGAADITNTTKYLENYADNYFCGNLTAGNTTPCSYTFTIRSTLDGGARLWNVWCRADSDLVGSYLSDENVNISVNDHPTAAITYPANAAWLHSIERLNAAASSDDQSIINYTFFLDNNSNFSSPSLICSSSQENCSFDTLTQTQCANNSMSCYLQLNVTDSDGLKNSTYITIAIDNDGPAAALDMPSNWTNITANSYKLNATINDTGIGVNVTIFLYRENDTETWKNACSDTEGISPFNCSWNLAILPDGNYYQIRVYANDSLGNIGNNYTTHNITIDRKPPIIYLESPQNNTWSRENVTFYYNVSDKTSNIANCSLIINGIINQTNISLSEDISLNFTINSFNDGNYNWSINCTDALGNQNNSETRIIKIDNTPPNVILDNPKNFTNISAASYTINASAADSGIGVNATVFYYRENSTAQWNLICTNETLPYRCSWDTGSLTEGNNYQVKVHANDSLGNVGLNDTHYNITIDRTPPTINLFEPANDEQDTDGTIIFKYNATDTLLGITNCSLIINDTINRTNHTITEGISQNFTLTNVANGDYTWNINCTDSAGNQDSSEIRNLTVNPDTDPPIINLTSPKDALTLSYNDITFSFNVSDALSGIANCSLIINGTVNQTNQTAITKDQINSIFTIDDMPDGDYLWNITCTDTASTPNIGYSKTFELTIQEATTLIVNLSLDRSSYESTATSGELANISTSTEDQFGNTRITNITVSIIKANTTIPWWNSSYHYRRIINISNNYNGTLETDYTINHTIDTQILINDSKIQASGSDLRIAFWNNGTNSWQELDRIVSGINTTNTSILFKTQKNISTNTSDSSYYVYYGNLSVTSPPENKSKVYFYYDSFDDDTRSRYNTTLAFDDPFNTLQAADEDDDSTITHNATGGNIRYTGTGGRGKSIRVETLSIKDLIIEVEQNFDYYPDGLTVFFQLGARITGTSYYFFNIPNEDLYDEETQIARYNDGIKSSLFNKKLQQYSDDTYYKFKFMVYDINSSTTALRVFMDDTEVLSHNDSAANRITDPGSFGTGSVQFVGNWDNLTVKRYILDEPTSASGSEEERIEIRNSETDSDGIYQFFFNTTNKTYANYSVISLAAKPPYYSNGIGVKFFEIRSDTTHPTITLNYPTIFLNLTDMSINFNWTADDRIDRNITCNLTINGKVNISDIDSLDETPINYTINNIAEGTHYWNITCIDDHNNTNTSLTYSLTIIDEPKNLNASLSSDNVSIIINWTGKTYSATYNIHIVDDYTTPFSTTPNVTGITGLNWTDKNANQSTKRFYKVTTIRGNANKTTSKTVGKYEVELLNNSESGTDWNLISIPFKLNKWELNNGTNNGYDFPVKPARCIITLWRYNDSIGWERTNYDNGNWSPATESDNFTRLEQGKGYWVEVNKSCNLTFIGEVPTEDTNFSLLSGWNMVGWYSTNSSNLLIVGEPPYYPIIVDPINSVDTIDKYNTITDSFEVTFHHNGWGWWPSDDNQDFTTINPTIGYYFDVNQAASWQHDPNT